MAEKKLPTRLHSKQAILSSIMEMKLKTCLLQSALNIKLHFEKYPLKREIPIIFLKPICDPMGIHVRYQ